MADVARGGGRGGPETQRSRSELRTVALSACAAAIAAVEPGRAVRMALRMEGDELVAGEHRLALRSAGRVVLLGMGKAGVPMTRAALDVLGDRVSTGLVVVKDGHAGGVTSLGPVRVAESGHPVPDRRGVALARECLRLAGECGPDDVAVVLVSGGGSSLVACPAEGLSIDDLAVVSSSLLKSGADIHEMNCVRKHLSCIHGGRLAQALGPARSLTLLVSDVIGDDPSSIASGPTHPDATTFRAAMDVIDGRLDRGRVPAAVLALLERGVRGDAPETPDRGTLQWERHAHVVVASSRDAVRAAAAALHDAGFEVLSLGSKVGGNAADVAIDIVERVRDLAQGAKHPVAVVAGGETTVAVGGDGLGGRNQHLACTAARELAAHRVRAEERPEVVVVAVGTDGTDGPTDAAGGIVDETTWQRAAAGGVDPDSLLLRFDSHELLRAAGDLVVTGPTGTNVMDLTLALAQPREAR